MSDASIRVLLNELKVKLKNKGMDLFKETHWGKSYERHVDECFELAEEISKLINLKRELREFIVFLCCLHDVGKLLPTWSLNAKNRPLHSIEGAEWLLENADIIDNKLKEPYIHLLIYTIMTHHTPLYVPLKLDEKVMKSIIGKKWNKYKSRFLLNELNSELEKLSREEILDLVDSIGIMKLADVISAKDLNLVEIKNQYYPQESPSDQHIEKKLIERAIQKRRSFDQEKYRKQLNLSLSTKPHIIVAAPTGWGKTNLALLRFVKKQPVKLFYILPTITAIKDFYHTFKAFFPEEYIGEYFYFADAELLGRANLEEEDLLDIYRYFVPKIIVTTIDQLLLTTLQVGKYHIRRFNLRNSLVVIDEFHLLTPQMMAALRLFLKHLSEHYKTSFLFMSATPSPIYIDLINKALPEHKVEVHILGEDYGNLKRHKVEIIDMNIEDFILKHQDLLKERTLIIVNTVRKAQNLYEKLKEIVKDKKVILIHGDFAYRDRAEIEEKIREAEILVATQVAEVSLDISYNLLITEIAPIPSLIQRFGRVNRYGHKAEKTNVYICRKIDSTKPYSNVLIDESNKKLPELVEGLEQVGEEIYLKEEFWEYEKLFERDILYFEENITKILEMMNNFYSVIAKESDILNMLGREEIWLAVPNIYLDDVLELRKKLIQATSFDERKRIYALIKGYLTHAPRSCVRNAEWIDGLNWPIVKYNNELGVIS